MAASANKVPTRARQAEAAVSAITLGGRSGGLLTHNSCTTIWDTTYTHGRHRTVSSDSFCRCQTPVDCVWTNSHTRVPLAKIIPV
jgi:hypothetical protein